MQIKDAVVNRINGLCATYQMTPNSLANAAGLTPSTVYSILDRNRKDITITTIKKLCDGFGISIADFFNTKAFRNLEQEMR